MLEKCGENVCMEAVEAWESNDVEKVWRILCADKKKAFVVVQITPAARIVLGEKFGFARGEDCAPKVVAVLKGLGADAVVDTAIAVDAACLMLANELKIRKEKGEGLPLYSAESPLFVNKIAAEYADSVGQLGVNSSEVCARLLRKHYGSAKEACGKKICLISIEACAKKKELPAADVVLTVEELWEILASTEVNLRLGRKEPLDTPLGVASGGAYVCAVSGGFAESVARCLLDDKTRAPLKKLAYSGLYGNQPRRTAEISVGETVYSFAVVSSMEEAVALLEDVKAGAAAYDFVEVTAREGGCIGGSMDGYEGDEVLRTRRLRALGLHYLDRNRAARSADMSSATVRLVKEWQALCRSGEAFAEIEEIDFAEIDEVFEPLAIEEVEEIAEVVEEVAEEPAVEETVEEAIEEPAVEETVEEVVEGPIVEEAVEEVVEEPIVEETVEEVAEEPAVEETVEEVVEEPAVEETVEEVVEEPAVEETVEEAIEEPVVEETVEEVVEEPAVEETAEEVAEEPAVEETAEEVVEESAVEETVEEVALTDLSGEEEREKNHYYLRLSTKEKNRLRRMRKKGK